jgi:hypothetical protein
MGTPSSAGPRPAKPPFLGLTRRRRMSIYLWLAVAIVLGYLVWAWIYLQPTRWYKYTDHVAFEQVARDVEVGHVVWEPASAEPVDGEAVRQPAIGSDSVRMVYSSGKEGGNADLFMRRWDGRQWGPPRPMRALNSAFHETAPALSGDGQYLYFASDRPGGMGGDDIWVAKWDGVEFAWPLPLTGRLNSPFDETDPAPSPDNARLYFASNRPYLTEAQAIKTSAFSGTPLEDVRDLKEDFDLYEAGLAAETPFDLIVERQLSMLYSLREGALADKEVMRKLGGTAQTESAIDRGLAYLAGMQEKDGRWDIRKGGGQGGHDVGATAFALLSFYGRGQRHDLDCKYRDTVARGLEWLLSQQNRASGDLRGEKPEHNAMYDHGIASLALIEAYGVTKDVELRPRAIAAIEFMTNSQHQEGGWRYKPGERGDLSVTGWYIMALTSARMSGIPVPDKTFDGSLAFLKRMSGGAHGGSYGYTDPPGRGNSNRHGMNAAGFFCSQLTGESPNSEQAWEAAGILGKVGMGDGDLYYLYYGTIAAYQHQGPLWRDWRGKMQKKFAKSQQQDGSWRPGGNFGGAMGSVIGTAVTVLCLEAHYRYTPLYGLGFEPNPDGPVAGALDESQLPPTPDFRNAKFLEAFNSPADDLAPVVTDHGDFLYCSSGRAGGLGGMDIYRSRISGAAPTPLENLGGEVNSAADETDPALRMEGFQLLFNRAGGEGQAAGLFSVRSSRLVKRHSYFNLPGFAWLRMNLPWLFLFVGAAAASVWLTRRALAAGRREHQAEGANV